MEGEYDFCYLTSDKWAVEEYLKGWSIIGIQGVGVEIGLAAKMSRFMTKSTRKTSKI